MEPTLIHYIAAAGVPIGLMLMVKNQAVRIFLAGMYFYAGISMAHQDWLGLESYKTYLDERWVNFHWGVGVTLSVIAFVVTAMAIKNVRKNFRALYAELEAVRVWKKIATGKLNRFEQRIQEVVSASKKEES